MKSQFQKIAFLILLLLLEGCVTKSRYLADVGQRDTALQEEQQKRANAEKSLAAADEREKELTGKIDRLNQQLALAKEIGSQTEQELKEKLLHMKGDFEQESQAHRDSISRLEARLSNQTDEIDRLKEALKQTEEEAARRERELQEANAAHKDLVGQLQKEITDGSIKITQLKDRLSVEIVDKILFASGSDQITPEGKGVLKKVSGILKGVKENSIRIEGHTDNVPIGSKLASKFPSNWELSTARATQVVRYLSDLGVAPGNLLAVGLAEYRPVASNDTPEGKQRNRRIEIVLYPKDLQAIAASVAPPE